MSDFHTPDGLSEFAPELGADTTPRVKPRAADTSARHEDWLSPFTTEALDAAPGALDDALVSPDEDLTRFAPEERSDHSPDGEYLFLDQFPHQEPAAILRPPRSVASWAATLVAGVIGVLWGMHALHGAWNAGREDARPSPASHGENAAVSSSPLSSALPPASRPLAPAAERGIPSRTVRHVDAAPIDVPHVAIANARPHRRASDTAPTAGRMPTPTASGSSGARTATGRAPGAPSRETVLSAQRPDRSLAVDLVPLTRVAVPSGVGEGLLPETHRPPLRPDAASAPLTTPNVSEAAVHEYAVRQTLHSYEKAYEGLDVAATAAVWPSVDRRALARAFDTLKSQGLDFESCAITVMDSRATARCRGTLQFVRKVGNSMPQTAEQEWVFRMRRLGADWRIDDVSASQAPVLTPQRIRSRG